MGSFSMELAVEMDGGGTWLVVADQRDFARYEVQPFGVPFGDLLENGDDGKPELSMRKITFTMLRFLAWSASVRQQHTKLTWPEFSDACVDAFFAEDPEEADPLAEPGPPAPSDGPSSTSPTGQASH